MELPVTAVYDANVLYPAPLRDLLIRLAQAGLVRARWSERQRESLRNPPVTAEDLLNTLENQGLVQTVARLRQFTALL